MQQGHDVQRLAVFDFCETLADFQTASGYVDFVRRNTRYGSVMRRNAVYVVLMKAQVLKTIDGLTGHRHSVAKRMKLWQLRGVPLAEAERLAERFYRECVVPHLVETAVDRMRRLQHEGYAVGLSSGGYGLYLKYFVDEYGLDFCHCSEIGFEGGRCTGRMKGRDCMNGEKTARLAAAFGEAPADSVSFSDSKSDLPLLRWTARAVVVSRGGHQDWIDKYNFNEIIW